MKKFLFYLITFLILINLYDNYLYALEIKDVNLNANEVKWRLEGLDENNKNSTKDKVNIYLLPNILIKGGTKTMYEKDSSNKSISKLFISSGTIVFYNDNGLKEKKFDGLVNGLYTGWIALNDFVKNDNLNIFECNENFVNLLNTGGLLIYNYKKEDNPALTKLKTISYNAKVNNYINEEWESIYERKTNIRLLGRGKYCFKISSILNTEQKVLYKDFDFGTNNKQQSSYNISDITVRKGKNKFNISFKSNEDIKSRLIFKYSESGNQNSKEKEIKVTPKCNKSDSTAHFNCEFDVSNLKSNIKYNFSLILEDGTILFNDQSVSSWDDKSNININNRKIIKLCSAFVYIFSTNVELDSNDISIEVYDENKKLIKSVNKESYYTDESGSKKKHQIVVPVYTPANYYVNINIKNGVFIDNTYYLKMSDLNHKRICTENNSDFSIWNIDR